MRVAVLTMSVVIALMAWSVFRPRPPERRDGGDRERIVSLAPSLTEVVLLLGAADRLVGVTRFCEGVDAAVARLGGYQPDYEMILSLRPQRVLAIETEIQRAGLEFLREQGIRVEVHRAESVQDIRAIVTALGESLDASAAAAEFVRRLDRSLEVVPAPGPAPRALFVVEWGPPHYVAGGLSFANTMLRAAGAENVFGDRERNYLPVDAERIVARDPDVIVDVTLLGSPPGHWAQLPQLRAVREGRVYRFPRVRPGTQIPAWIDQLRELFKARQP